MKISLQNKKALIGGSSKGLGFAVAEQLALSGAQVTIVSSNEKLLKERVFRLNKITSQKHNFLVCDYNDYDNYSKKITDYFDTNTIDILVNNTQGPIAGDVNSVSINDYQNAFDLLFKNIVLTTTLALKNMRKKEWGRIINMASVSVKEPLKYLALSNTIRSAVTTWGKTLSNEVAESNITVNNILTGYFNTERLEQLNSEKAKKMGVKLDEVLDIMKNQVPAKRIGDPKEFGYLVTFLSSDNASYINGINIAIDGGLIKSL